MWCGSREITENDEWCKYPLLYIGVWKWGLTFRVFKLRITLNGRLYSNRQRLINVTWGR